MSRFKWTDRFGTSHMLDHYQSMAEEIRVIQGEMDELLPGLESPDREVRDRARPIVEERHHRLVQLQADIVRWNAHADAETQSAAADILGQIAQLGSALQDMRLVVGLHDEHAKLLRDSSDASEQRDAALAGPASPRQMLAIELMHSTSKPSAPTRAEAWTWLNSQPRFRRTLASDGGWFAWVDPDGHAHRLIDPLPIERMAITLLGQLEAMRDDLGMRDAPERLFITVERGVALMNKVNAIKSDLDRFDREADARDLAQCKAYAADWRSRRRTQ
jgi:hypothetical protein